MRLPDEAELVMKLRSLYGEYERLNGKITLAVQRRRISRDPDEVARAQHDELQFLAQINGLMDRMKIIERGLLRARGVRPVPH